MSVNLKKKMTCNLQSVAPKLFSYGTERVEVMQYYPQPVMEISVKKTKLDDSSQSSKEPGLNCLLYEARNNLQTQYVDEIKFKEKLLQINPAMPLAQILAPRTSDRDRIETRFGRFQPGSYGSYQLPFTEANF